MTLTDGGFLQYAAGLCSVRRRTSHKGVTLTPHQCTIPCTNWCYAAMPAWNVVRYQGCAFWLRSLPPEPNQINNLGSAAARCELLKHSISTIFALPRHKHVSLKRDNAASSASVRIVERRSFSPVWRSSAVWRLRQLPAPRRARSLRSSHCSSGSVDGRGVSVVHLSRHQHFYNPRRRHSALRGKSPLAFERQAA